MLHPSSSQGTSGGAQLVPGAAPPAYSSTHQGCICLQCLQQGHGSMCYHLQRALMSATGSGTAAEHRNKMRSCLERSPKLPQVLVLKEEA